MDGPPALTIEPEDAAAGDAFIAAGLSAALMASIAALTACGALQSHEHALGATCLVFLSLALTGLLIHRARRQEPASVLRWDGQSWYWSCGQEDALCAVQWMMDVQYGMLLRVHMPDGSRKSLWLRRKAHAKNWCALRRALIFSGSTAYPRVESGLSWHGG